MASGAVATSPFGSPRRLATLGRDRRTADAVGQPRYSNLEIVTALTLRVVFHLPLRQTEGFLDSLLRLMELDLKAPDHTTLSRRLLAVISSLCSGDHLSLWRESGTKNDMSKALHPLPTMNGSNAMRQPKTRYRLYGEPLVVARRGARAHSSPSAVRYRRRK